MSDPFEQAITFTLGPSIEGGVSNVAGDHGGLTNHGVTQKTYDAYRAEQHQPPQSVVQMTLDEAHDLYRTMFWNAAHCPELPARLAVAHFDWAVNHSPRGAIRTLQQAAGVGPDGLWGPNTAGACTAADPDALLGRYLDLRAQWYHDDVAKDASQAQFLKGWLARVEKLRGYLATLPA